MSISLRHEDRKRKPRPDLSQRNRDRAKHGLSGSPTMKTWEAMVRRCTKIDEKDYPRYGGRGISVCSRWLHSFEAFVADMGVKPEGTSLDRIDNQGDYEIGNCRWATATEQANNRRSSKFVAFNGRSQTVAEWAREIGIGPKTLAYRLRTGWTPEAAFSSVVDRTMKRAS